MGDPIWLKSAVEIAAAVREGALSAEETVGAAIERMRAVNPSVNAVVVDMSEQAMREARAADAARPAAGRRGLLDGVPVTIKINVDVQGQANSNGVAALKDRIAHDDAPIARNLRNAGAIVIGMTNTPEHSMRAFTANPLHGRTLNPWNPAVTCGGSSGGAGAAVALGIGAIAHGNDIGGSLRWPAHCNGVATIKATQGRMPAYNPSAPAERPMMAQLMSVQGPMAREVRDVRLGFEVMSRPDPRDPWQTPAPLDGPRFPQPIRVALAKIPDQLPQDPRIVEVVRGAADILADAGYAVEEVEIPDVVAAWRLWGSILLSELKTLQYADMTRGSSEEVRNALDGMIAMSEIMEGADFLRACAERTGVIREWLLFLERYPLILCPATTMPTFAPDADQGGPDAVRHIFEAITFISAINVLGLPAAVVPAGLVDGLPVGAQLVASRFREDLCLDAAQAIETRVGVLTRRMAANQT